MFKKISLSVLSLIAILFFVVGVQVVRAQSAQAEKESAMKAGQTSANLENTSFEVFNNMLYSASINVGGCVSNDCPLGADGKPITDGAIKGIGRLIGEVYKNKPADTQTYIASLMQDMNIAQPAYAQGVGFSSLAPLLEIWKLFRNIAYVFFVFIFLIIGFAIMFRQNLGGQAAVTIQQALPRIIVALLMVTFSYAIAGLLIDIMYISMFFLVIMFSGTSLLDATLTNFGDKGNILSQNIFSVYFSIITGNFAGSSGAIIGKLVEESIGSAGLGSFLGGIAGGLTNILATLIIFFAILFAMFKTFFSLVKVYIEIILSIAFAPVILMMGAVQGNVFGNWVKGLMANLAVFPAMLVFIIIGFLLVGGPNSGKLTDELNNSGFIPPFLPGRGSASNVGLVAGIGAIMLLPEVAGMMARFKPKGLFDDLGSLAVKNVTPAVPLATRLAGIGVMGGGDALITGARKFRAAEGTIGERFQQAREAAFKEKDKGFNRGASRGVQLAGWATRVTGANQPDYVNPITNRIDKRFDPTSVKREEFLQNLEFASKRLGTGGVGSPEESEKKKK